MPVDHGLDLGPAWPHLPGQGGGFVENETDPERQSYFFNKENPVMKEVYFFCKKRVYFQSHQTSEHDFDSPVKLNCTLCYLL